MRARFYAFFPGQKNVKPLLDLPEEPLTDSFVFVSQPSINDSGHFTKTESLTNSQTEIDHEAIEITTPISDGKYINSISQQIDPNSLDIKRIIATGSFGNVYLGTWNNMQVAVKSIKLNHIDFDYAHSTFLREISISRELTKLNVPNVVKFFGFVMGSDNVVSSIVMENVAYSMADLLKSKTPLSNQAKYEILKEVTTGVSWLHVNHIVHRDLKPDNVLIDQYFHAKLCDFGFARKINENNTSDRMVGSARWLAPELIISFLIKQPYSEKAADVWSLCTIYWEIYASVLPFAKITDNLEVIRAIKNGAIEDISKVNDPKIAHLIKTYGWVAADRRATAKELLEKLNEPDVPGLTYGLRT